MRIALFTETFIPKVDGIVTTLCQTVKQLKGLGHDVLIIAPEGGVTEYEQCRIVGIRGHALPLYPELRLSFPQASIRRILDDFQPDVIHAVEPILLGIAALYYARSTGDGFRVPLLISYHTDLPKYLAYYKLGLIEPYIWPLLRMRHNRAAVNLCTSETMVRQLRDHGIARVALWPGAVDTGRFQPAFRSEAMRARLSQGHPESPLLLYVGRLSPEKEIERILPVLRAVPQARLALVGDGPHRRALQKHFAGFPAFMAGFLHGDELAAAYASSDIFIMPSPTETLGLVVLEAMASGLPVVAARAGGIPDIINDGTSGFLFDDTAQATTTVQRLVSNPQLRESVSHAAREAALNRNWEAATDQLVEHYQAACAMWHTAPALLTAPTEERPGLSFFARQALGAATFFALRKLLE